MTLKERMPMFLKERQEDLATLRANMADPAKDRNGSSSSSVKGTVRFIGAAVFVVSRDIDQFRRFLSEAARIRLRLFERREQGEPIAKSYVVMLAYKNLFDALAAGDFDTAERLAKFMGGRKELEAKYDHPFDYCLGYTLKAFVERNTSDMAYWASRFSAICKTDHNDDFMGYAEVFNGILYRNEAMAQKGLLAIAKGHKNQTKRGGVFEGLEDEALCVWGTGIANLARHSGLAITGSLPFIPPDLLI